MDRFFVEKLLSFEYLGQYGVAVQLMEQLFLLIGIVIQSISPKIIFIKGSYFQISNSLKKTTMYLLSLNAIGLVVAYLTVPYIITSIFGSKYSQSITILYIMLPASFFFIIDSVIAQLFYRDKQSKIIFYKWLFTICFSVVGYFFIKLRVIDNPGFVFLANYFVMAAYSLISWRRYGKNKN